MLVKNLVNSRFFFINRSIELKVNLRTKPSKNQGKSIKNQMNHR